MEFFDVVAARHSVRTYKPDPVPDAVITQCLEAARVAPSWRNGQCWRFVVIREREMIARLAAHAIVGSGIKRENLTANLLPRPEKPAAGVDTEVNSSPAEE